LRHLDVYSGAVGEIGAKEAIRNMVTMVAITMITAIINPEFLF
jgi:hypothetical protein